MPVAYWRRPNPSGHWGSVAGTRWERADASDFKVAPDGAAEVSS